MSDTPVKCTRCRHACMSSEWVDVPSKRFGGCTESTCPRCGCRSFYDCTPKIAWCWASGLIEIGDELPADSPDGSGAIEIARGPAYALIAAMEVAARHGYQRGELLVPGVPEAATEREKGDALVAWIATWRGRKRSRRDTVVFAGSAEVAA